MAETHLSNSDVIFYRSSQPGASWISTVGAILDACSLFSSTVDRQDVPWVNLCYQAGCRTLKAIATDVGIPLGSALAGAHARCGDPIQISGYLGKSDVFEAEDLQSGRVVAIPCLSEEQHSA